MEATVHQLQKRHEHLQWQLHNTAEKLDSSTAKLESFRAAHKELAARVVQESSAKEADDEDVLCIDGEDGDGYGTAGTDAE